MADLGAEVIKIEDPVDGGDEARKHGPFPGDVPHPEKSGLFLWLNANKKGIYPESSIRSRPARSLKNCFRKRMSLSANFPPAKAEPELGTLIMKRSATDQSAAYRHLHFPFRPNRTLSGL